MTRAKLKLVDPVEQPITLRDAFIGRDEAMRSVREFDAIIAERIRDLAKERGVIFLRQEAVRQEMGV